MKYLLIPIAAVMVAILFAFNTKDEIKSQSEHVKSVPEGVYTVYLARQDANGKYTGGIDNYSVTLKPLNSDKNQPNEHFEVMIEKTWRESKKVDKMMFLADNMAFPITYRYDAYEGNKKMQAEKGYLPRQYAEAAKRPSKQRLVFLDGMIYMLEDWKSPQDYKLRAVLIPGSEPKGLKMMKEVLKSPKKMTALDPAKKVKEYIDAAYAKQQQIYPSWKSKNASLVAKMDKMVAAYGKAIKDQRSMYFKNSTGRDIYIYWGDDMKAGVLANGATANYICGTEYFYDFTGKRWKYPNDVVRISRAGDNSKCADQTDGKPYEIK